MFHYAQRRKQPQKKRREESAWEMIQKGARIVMDFILSAYFVLMTMVMPFYFQDGYAHIATDKAEFCGRVSIYMWRVLLPVFAVYLGASLVFFLRKYRGGLTKELLLRQLGGLIGDMTLTDRFMALYGAALILSYFCSDYQEKALWGAGSGWYTGLLPQLMLVLAYFFFVRFCEPRKTLFDLMLLASAAVFLLGYLNRFSVYPIHMNLSSPSFISTIGNINWYCGYLITVFFAGVALFWQGGGGRLKTGGMIGYMLLGFGSLVTQGSASGILTLAVMLLVLFCMSAGDGVRMKRFWAAVLLLSAACLFTGVIRRAAPDRMNFNDGAINLLTVSILPFVMAAVSLCFLIGVSVSDQKGVYPKKCFVVGARIAALLAMCLLGVFVVLIAVNTTYPGSIGPLSKYAAFTFSDTWGSNRGATWKAGVMCFAEQDFLHKLVGVGPDAMASFTYQDGSEELIGMLDRVFGVGVSLTNAHNEWLTVLVNTGILGLTGFAGAMITAVAAFLKRCGKNKFACACGFSLLAYTVNNIFSFQQTINLTTMMMILSMGMAFLREGDKVE